MRDPHLTQTGAHQIILNTRRCLCEEGWEWGVWRGGGGLESKWKRETEKGDNEGRDTQIG